MVFCLVIELNHLEREGPVAALPFLHAKELKLWPIPQPLWI